jgi:para-nitrobenzyl esterase
MGKISYISALIIALCSNSACSLFSPSTGFPLVVETVAGKIEGKEGEISYYFKGIPYAEPPLGNLRWKPPSHKIPWQGLLKADSFSKACPQVQPMYIEEKIEWDEDCLCLNIYRPKENKRNLPVMVFIHGGAFMDGAASLSTFNGEWLAQNKEVVLVTINYRLAQFGFLYIPEADIVGNYGIRDQIKALEWIQGNIKAFGGDPDNITVFGESAGGVSVGLLLGLRPELFHKAIIQSGYITFNPDMMSPDTISAIGQRFVREIGCEGAGDCASCLRSKSAKDVLSAGSITFKIGSKQKYGPILDGAFITAAPLSLIKNGKGANTPLIMGLNADEGAFFALTLGIKTEKDYENWVRNTYPDLADSILSTYSASHYERPDQAAADVLGDAIFACPTRKALKNLSAVNKSLYHYYFTYPPEATRKLGVGAFHGAELSYIFHTFKDKLKEAEQVSQTISELWTSFAYEGIPSCGKIRWQPFTSQHQHYLVINKELATEKDLRKEQCDIWDRCDWYLP